MIDREGLFYCNDLGEVVGDGIWRGRKGNSRADRTVSWNNKLIN